MRSIQNRFLQTFKAVELAIKNSSSTPNDANFKWLEDQVTDAELQSKMRLCRMLRNFLVHESCAETFCEVNEEQIEFLRSFLDFKERSGSYIGDVAYDVRVCETVNDVLSTWGAGASKIVCKLSNNYYLISGSQVKDMAVSRDYDFYTLAMSGRQLPLVLYSEPVGEWCEKNCVVVDADRNVKGFIIAQ